MLYLFIMITLLGVTMAWIVASLSTSKSMLPFKMVLITSLIYISVCIFYSFDSVRGWPTDVELPEKFELQYVVIEEPSFRSDKDGGIFLWVIPQDIPRECPSGVLCVRTDGSNTPRAYRIDYSREMHEQMLGILDRIKNGETIIVEREGDPSGSENHSPNADGMNFYSLPDFQQLRKD